MHAMDLTKLQEDKYSEMRKSQRTSYTTSTYPLMNYHLPTAMSSEPLLPKQHNNIPVKKLSPSELQD